MEISPYITSIDYEKLAKSKIHFKSTRPRPIFHYTSIGGMEGILRSRTLRFTNIKYMNDKDEIIAGLDSMAKACAASQEERERLQAAYLSHGLQTFVCCFSIEDDSLPMWNYYTKEVNNQGFNIEFDDKQLVESILRDNPLLDGCEFSYGRVDYSKDDESEYSKILTKEMLSSMELAFSKIFLSVLQGAYSNRRSNIDSSALEAWENKIEQTEKKKKLNDLPVYFYNGMTCSFDKASTGSYLYFVKRDYFKQEKEFRIVISVPDEFLPKLAKGEVYKFRMSNGALVPYLELHFSPNVVKSITISPTVQSDLIETSIRDYMAYCGFEIEDFSKFIRHSNVPVRF